MRFLRALLIGLITAVAGMFVAAVVGDYLTTLAHIPDMEGQRGMAIIFVCLPLGILAGFAIGVVASILVRRRAFAGFLIAQGWALLVVCGFAALLAGIPYLLSDKPPRLNGKELLLEFELRVPLQFTIPDTPSGDSIRVSLYSGNRETTYAFVDWGSIKRAPDAVTIPGRVQLLTHNPARSLFAVVGSDPMAGQFIQLRLPASPGPRDEQWSGRVSATQRANLEPVPEADRFSARYRVRSVD